MGSEFYENNFFFAIVTFVTVILLFIFWKSSLIYLFLQEAVARQKKAPTPLMEVSSESQPTFTTLTKSDNKIDWF